MAAISSITSSDTSSMIPAYGVHSRIVGEFKEKKTVKMLILLSQS